MAQKVDGVVGASCEPTRHGDGRQSNITQTAQLNRDMQKPSLLCTERGREHANLETSCDQRQCWP